MLAALATAVVLLITYVPSAKADDWKNDPEVSWYGPGFYGNRTACGLAYTKTIMGVAHRSLPCGTKVTFRNPANGRVFTVPVIDRGPYVKGRQWDLSGGLCFALDHCYTGPIQYRLGGSSNGNGDQQPRITPPPTDTGGYGPTSPFSGRYDWASAFALRVGFGRGLHPS